jgi:uncharacterized membrane protein YuzA (DUF378 family)
MKVLEWISLLIVVIVCLNMAVAGLFAYDLIGGLIGTMEIVWKIYFAVVGIAALILLFTKFVKTE